MPLIMIGAGETGIVQRIEGTPEMKKHLENLGFVTGTVVEVLQKSKNGLIVRIKDCRVALSRELAGKIMV